MRAVTLFGSAMVCATVLLSGCSGSPDESSATSDELQLARSNFARDIADVERTYKGWQSCQTGGPCLRPAGSMFSDANLCDTLRPLRNLAHPYVIAGAAFEVNYVGPGYTIGTEVVFDLWNREAAVFWYGGGTFATRFAYHVGAYLGYAFGDEPGVIDAFANKFTTGTLGVHIPVLNLGAGARGFFSEGSSVFGAAIEVNWDDNFIPTPIDAGVGIRGEQAWDFGTRKLEKALLTRGWHEEMVDRNGRKGAIIKFDRPRDMALSLLQLLGPMFGSSPALQALAVSAVRQSGAIERMCP